MSYASGEALILTQIQACSGFSSANATRGIYTIVNSGKAKSYAILRPDSFTNEQTGLGAALGTSHKAQYTRAWVTICEIWVSLRDYGASLAELEARRQEIIERFDSYPHAADQGATIEDVTVVNGGNVFEVASQAGPVFLRQDLTITWRENINAQIQE